MSHLHLQLVQEAQTALTQIFAQNEPDWVLVVSGENRISVPSNITDGQLPYFLREVAKRLENGLANGTVLEIGRLPPEAPPAEEPP